MKIYNSFGNYWYDGDTCPDCNVMLSHDNTDYNAGRNGITCSGITAGQQKKVRYCNGDYLKRMKERYAKFKKFRLLNTAPAKVVTFLRPSNIAPFSYPPEHEKRLRRDGRTTESAIIARKADRNGGFNYIMEHPSWPERKIGWTYDPPSRLSDFNVCCPHKSFTFPYISAYLEDAKLAESTVQAALKEFHVTGEWYLVSRELAIKTIEDYVESLNELRQKQAMG